MGATGRRVDTNDRAITAALGYHFVLDNWRFHMTLSDGFSGNDESREKTVADAQAHFAKALDANLGSGEIGVFVEPSRGAAFVLRERIPIGQVALPSSGHPRAPQYLAVDRSIKRVVLVYFNAGGGHRAAAEALKAGIEERGLPWTTELVDLFAIVDPTQQFTRITGMAPEAY